MSTPSKDRAPARRRLRVSLGRGRLADTPSRLRAIPAAPLQADEHVAGSSSNQTTAVDLSGLINVSWTMYALSPMYRFDMAAASLERYSSSLKEFLRQNTVSSTRAIAEDHNSNGTANTAPFNTTIELLPGLSQPCAIVKINARPASQATTARGSTAGSLFAYLLTLETTVIDGFLSLPLLLIKGPAATIEHIINWLQGTFDCRAMPLKPQPLELQHLAQQWCNDWRDGPGSKGLELSLSFPAVSPQLKTLTITVTSEHIVAIRNAFITTARQAGEIDDNQDYFPDLGEKVLIAVAQHVSTTLRVDLSAGVLYRLGTSQAFIGAEGKLKLYEASPDRALTILTSVIQLAIACNVGSWGEEEAQED